MCGDRIAKQWRMCESEPLRLAPSCMSIFSENDSDFLWLMTVIDGPEVAQCELQDVKMPLLTNSWEVCQLGDNFLQKRLQ